MFDYCVVGGKCLSWGLIGVDQNYGDNCQCEEELVGVKVGFVVVVFGSYSGMFIGFVFLNQFLGMIQVVVFDVNVIEVGGFNFIYGVLQVVFVYMGFDVIGVEVVCYNVGFGDISGLVSYLYCFIFFVIFEGSICVYQWVLFEGQFVFV